MKHHLRGALDDFRRTWPQLLTADLLSAAIAFVVSTPLVGLLLGLFLRTTEDRVLTDADIAAFFLHPLGWVALVLLGGVSLGVYLSLQGLLMVIGMGAAEGHRVTYLDALRHVASRSLRFGRLAGRISASVLLLGAPFLVCVGGVYLWLLRAHDINYYLSSRPTEFLQALALAGGLALGLVALLSRSLPGWVLALPVVLFEDASAGEALRKGRRLAQPWRWRIAGYLAAWLAGALLASTVAALLVLGAGSRLMPDLKGNAILVCGGLVLLLTLSGLVSYGVRFVAGSLLPLAVVHWYRELSGPIARAQPIATYAPLGRQSAGLPRKAVLAAAALAVLAVGASAYVAARGAATQDRVQIIAHRGASADAPENTLAAFERALEQGADWIELDVQENAEGELVVAHDSDFMKQAGSPLKVWDARAQDLRELDIGSWFDPAFSDQRVQTLREVLMWARGRIGVVIELKYYGHDERLEARVVEVVEETGMQADVMVMSLNRPGLVELAELRPEWPRGLLNTASIGDLTGLDLDFLALNAAAASRSQIRKAHARGMKVFVWTINDPVQMSMLLSRGADGLITDLPAEARKVLELRDDLSPLGQFILWMAGESGLLHRDRAPSPTQDA